MLDYDTRRVSLFREDGRFDRFLEVPAGLSPATTRIPRLAALADGGLVLADEAGNQFLFYDVRLMPARRVPFGITTLSLNGLVRHPSGDLYVVAFSPDSNKILHRFDPRGRYLGSFLETFSANPRMNGFQSGQLTVDPDDGSLWLSRLTPYEILHVSPDGSLLGQFSRDVPSFTPPAFEDRGNGFFAMGGDFGRSVKIAVMDGMVVNSYVLPGGRHLADVFRRDGTIVATGLETGDARAFAKYVGHDVYVRHFNEPSPRVEVWRRIP